MTTKKAKEKDVKTGRGSGLISLAKRSLEERKKISKAGGIASGKARREKKTTKEILNILLDSKISDEEKAKKYEMLGLDASRRAELLDSMIKSAAKNSKQAELLFSILGDLQTTTQSTTNNNFFISAMSDDDLAKEHEKLLQSQKNIIDMTPERS